MAGLNFMSIMFSMDGSNMVSRQQDRIYQPSDMDSLHFTIWRSSLNDERKLA